MTLSLVEISLFNAITNNSPNVKGLSAISAWVLICILFVFAALLGYVVELIKKYWTLQVSLFSFEKLFSHCRTARTNFNYSSTTGRPPRPQQVLWLLVNSVSPGWWSQIPLCHYARNNFDQMLVFIPILVARRHSLSPFALVGEATQNDSMWGGLRL